MSDTWSEGEETISAGSVIASSAVQAPFAQIVVSKGLVPVTKAKQEAETSLPKHTADERAAGQAAKKALNDLTKEAESNRGQTTWEEWMTVAKGYVAGREYAKRCAGGKTNGKTYSTAMSKFLNDYELQDALDKSTRARLLSCYAHRVEIEAWRNEKEGAKTLNNPILVWNAFKPAPAKAATTAATIAEGLIDSYSDDPKTIARDVIVKKCRVTKDTDNNGMALAVAELLTEFVDAAAKASESEQDTKKKDLLYHFGHDFLKEVAEIIKKME